MKKSRTTLLTILSALIALPIAYAASPHFKSDGLTVSFSATGGTLTVEGDFAGLGNAKTANFNIDADGTVDGTCTNPNGHEPEGQQRPLALDEDVNVPVDKSGNATLDETFPLEFSCKGKAMEADIESVTITSLTVTVQGAEFTCTIPGGALVLTGSSTAQLNCD